MSKIQFRLFQLLHETFPEANDIFMSYAHPNMIFQNSDNLNMTLDVYIPSLKVAFEYQVCLG